MRWLLSVLNAGDRAVVSQTNFELLDREVVRRLPTFVEEEPNTQLGPPTVGEFAVGDLWTDARCAVFRCTADGGPGTWVQLTPATVLSGEEPESPPANYLIEVPDLKWARFYWDADAGAFMPVFLQP